MSKIGITINDFYSHGFINKDGALINEHITGCVQYWDGRWFYSGETEFKKEISTIDELNNLLIELATKRPDGSGEEV